MNDQYTQNQPTPPSVERLLAEHARLRAMLAVFERQLNLFARDDAPDYAILGESLAWCRDYINTCHHPKEEALLERLRERDPESVAACTDLSEQHTNLGTTTEWLIKLFEAAAKGNVFVRAELVEAGERLVRELREHLDWEERHFFPRLNRELKDNDWSAVTARFKDMTDPMGDHAVDDQYRTLFAAISEEMGDDAADHG